jgi:Arc/MetJ-type ribon-helix-helix transcriptional regulator
MTTRKVALTIPEEALRLAKREVVRGRAKSLSAFVSEAVEEKLAREALSDVLDALDKAHGKPTKRDREWAERVLR